MSLTRVTITGADDATDPKALTQLWELFPFVEWGILIGSQSGSRMPSVEWIHQLILERESTENRMPLSLHVCGKFLREIASGKSSLIEHLGPQLFAFKRMQLNWHGEWQNADTGENILYTICSLDMYGNGWDPELIFQLDGINNHLWKPASRRFACTGLFDVSHGAGVLPTTWPAYLPEIGCGWAGGLGPDNLREEIPKITLQAAPARDFWIDMETKVRTEYGSRLHLEKVRECLEISQEFIGK